MLPTLFAALDVQLSRLLGLSSHQAATVVRELEEIKARFSFHELEETAIPSYTHRLSPIRYVFLKRLQSALVLLRRNLPVEQSQDCGVLDYGCGAGLMTIALHHSGFSPSRYDIRPAVCLPTAQAHSALLEVATPAETAQFAQFKSCVALDVLEHLSATDLHSFLASFRPGARLVVSGPTENRLYRLGRRLAGFRGGYHQRNIYQILRQMEQAGWSRLESDIVLSRFYCPAFVVACLLKEA